MAEAVEHLQSSYSVLHFISHDVEEFLRFVNSNKNEVHRVKWISSHPKAEIHLIAIILDALIPSDEWNTQHNLCCIAARDFITALLADGCNARSPIPRDLLDPFKARFFSDCILRLNQCLNVYSTVNSIPGPPVAHALGVLSDFIQQSSQSGRSGLFLNDIISLSVGLESAVQSLMKNMSVVKLNDKDVGHLEVFLYELFRLWRRAIKVQADLETSDSLLHDSRIPLAIINTTETLLLRCSYSFTNEDISLEKNISVTIIQLMLRGLRTLCKLLPKIDKPFGPVAVQYNHLVRTLVCGQPDSPLGSNLCLHPFIRTLLHSGCSASLASQSDDHATLDFDDGHALRILLLLALDLVLRLDPSDLSLSRLLQSIQAIVVSTSTQHISQSPTYEALTVLLLTGDDAQLIRGLRLWLDIANKLDSSLYLHQPSFIPDPHWMFANLLEVIGYSPYVLVDWIVSPETEILSYLVHYLRLFRRCTPPCRTHHQLDQEHLASDQPCGLLLPQLWPKDSVITVLSQVGRTLQTLDRHGNLPFNPRALLRSMDLACSILKAATFQ